MAFDPQLELQCQQARNMMRNLMGVKYEQRMKQYKDMLLEVQKKFQLPNVMMACSHCLAELDQPHHKQIDPDGWARAAILAATLDMIEPQGSVMVN
jgi:hypothetical protein